MNRSIMTIAALFIATPALGWKHTGNVWAPEQLPVEFTIADVGEDSLPEPFVDAEYAILQGFAAWDDAECSTFESDYLGSTPENTPFQIDNQQHFSFDDPGGTLGAGVKAVTQYIGSATIVFNQDGKTYFRFREADIIFNDGFSWVTDQQIQDGACFDGHSIQATATHEIGHFQGLGHSCEENEECPEQNFAEATMYWSAGTCASQRSQINSDDIDGITAIYGPYATFQCSREMEPGDPDTIAFGTIPFTINCSVISKNVEEIVSVEWLWGDGNSATGLNVSHEYTEAGNFTVRALITGENEACGEWDYNHRRVSYVRACDVPQAQSSFDHIDGLTYQLLNETNVSVYGCIYEIQWDIFEEGGSEPIASIQAWEPQFTFPDEGNYRIVLNVGGPAGTGAAELLVEAKNKRGEGYGGCSAVGVVGPAGFGSGLLLLGFLGLRRRRS